jgi:polysaccharide biosynthesis protein PelA
MSKSIAIPLTLLVLLLFFLIFSITTPVYAKKHKIKSWLCYYSNRFGPEVYSRFDLAVFDGTYHPPIEKNRPGKPILLGYVSIGEVDRDGPLWHLAKGKPFLVQKNRFWNSWIVDVSNPQWQNLLFDVAIPAVFERGFDGLFLDTFDSPLALLQADHAKAYAGIPSALVAITRRLRKEYPDKYIAINRGLPILSDIARLIDFVVAEDLYSYYSDSKKDYVRVTADTQDLLLKQLEKGRKANPDLMVLSLDYAAQDQTDIIKEAISFSRKRGFIPYVSTYQLDEIFFHTLTQ